MAIRDYFPGRTPQLPAKRSEKYEDMPVTTGILADFVGYKNERNNAFYFLLTEITGTRPTKVLPRGAPVATLDPLNIQNEEFEDFDPKHCRYLYAIDNKGIHVALENSRSIARRDELTHTNLCKRAYFGGEVFFLPGNRVILSPNSGRFGLSPNNHEATALDDFQERWDQTIACWEAFGFTVYSTIDDLSDLEKMTHRGWNGRVLAEAASEMIAAGR